MTSLLNRPNTPARQPGPPRSAGRVVVLGGGISGLVAALRLSQAGRRVTLVEAGDRLGGKLRTERVDGFLIEAGPDSFLTARPAATALVRELGLERQLIAPIAPRTVYLWHRGRLEPFPEGFTLGVPDSARAAARAARGGILTWRETARVTADLVLPRRRDPRDESVAALLRRRFGDALVERIAGPLLGSIYGTPVDELSVAAALPQFREAERTRASLIAGLRELRRARERSAEASGDGRSDGSEGRRDGSIDRGDEAGASLPPFLSLRDGMESLAVALVGTLKTAGVEARTGARAVGLERVDAMWRVRLEGGANLEGSDVVIALPAPAAARLLEPRLPSTAARLREIRYASTANVSLAYAVGSVSQTLRGHGFIAGERSALASSAGTFVSSKWPGRAPDGAVLIRLSMPSLAAAPDEELVLAARGDVAALFGIRAEPVLARVARFAGEMPQYTVGHLDRVASIEAAVGALPGLQLAGAAFRGVGIPDCIVSGERAAAAVVARGG